MSFFDVVADMLNPKSLDGLGKILQIVQISKKMGKQPAQKDIEALSSVLKKGWIEEAEKQVKNDVKRYSATLKVKPSLPDNIIDNLERKVIVSYKKERNKGLETADCKATIKTIRDLEREVARHEKALNEYTKSALLAKKFSIQIVQKYKIRQRTATVLRDALAKALQNPAYGILSSELVVYFIQCKDLAKYLRQAANAAKKLGDRAKNDARLGAQSAEYASQQLFYIRSSDYLEDLEGRIS